MNLRRGERLVFTVATAAALMHALDDAFINRQPGVAVGEHAIAAAIAVVIALAALVAFPRLRPGLRAVIALVFGVLAIVNGGLHVAHVSVDGPARSDLTGLVATAAGVVLVGLAAWIPFGHRGEWAGSRRRRWRNRVIGAVAVAAVAFLILMPVGAAIVVTHKFREPIDEPPSRAYRDVRFRSSDGLQLSGWYVPSRNRAAVIVVHGGGGDRTGGLDQARLLARHGYGVLLYDARGRGESEGTPNSLGWEWDRDVAGAVEFLRRRPDVDPERLGGLGLSTGADVLIAFGAERRALKAIVAEGATAWSHEDQINAVGFDSSTPHFFGLTVAVGAITSSWPSAALEELAAKVPPTPLLLIAAGKFQNEVDFNRVYAEAARGGADMWERPEGSHTAAVREEPQEYERRVIGLFDRVLLRR